MQKYKIKMGELFADVSRQLTQNGTTYFGIRTNNIKRCIIIKKKIKENIIKKIKGKVNHLERLHCISIFLGINNLLNDINKIIICGDFKTHKLKESMKQILSKNDFNKIKIIIKNNNPAHQVANKCYKHKNKFDCFFISEKDILKQFKKVFNWVI